MNNTKLKPCPFCGRKPELIKYHESVDGRGDVPAFIKCACQAQMLLSMTEFRKAENDFGYTGGYYSSNKEFWNGMHDRLIEKWNNQNTSTDNLIKRIEENFEDIKKACVNTYGDCEDCKELMAVFRDYTDEIIRIIEEEVKEN